MLAECSTENCTVAATGQCLLNNDPATCPHRRLESPASIFVADELLPEPERNPSFTASATLSAEQLGALMADRYCTMIGIIGPPDSGKTAALVSAYLLLASGQLSGYDYADSRSLKVLDEISRGARVWANGGPPDQMTAHTEMSDDRAAGFLHLRIRPRDVGKPVELLLPDLPGEWSTAMVDEGRHERLAFIRRADALWLMVNGKALAEPSTRQHSIHRTKVYLQRLKEFFPDLPRVILVVSRADESNVPEKTISAITAEAAVLGVALLVRFIASFSENPDVAPGTGIAELIRDSLQVAAKNAPLWPTLEARPSTRAMHQIGLGGIDP